MSKVTVKQTSVGRELRLLSDRAVRLAALKRAFGSWKGVAHEGKREWREIRKSWDRPLPVLRKRKS